MTMTEEELKVALEYGTIIDAESCEEWLKELRDLASYANYRKDYWRERMYKACIALIDRENEKLKEMNKKL
jgi:hypothetical protein